MALPVSVSDSLVSVLFELGYLCPGLKQHGLGLEIIISITSG